MVSQNAKVRVGRSAAAQEMNCTDEEAAILSKNIKPYKEPNRWLSGPVGALLRALLFNKGAALFLGTVGYWTFGLTTMGAAFEGKNATSFLRTGVPVLDNLVGNPMIMMVISFFLLVYGLSDRDRYDGQDSVLEAMWGGLAAMVLIPSFASAMVWGVLSAPIILISLFGLMTEAPFNPGILFLFGLPWGYVLVVKATSEQ